MPIGVVKVWMEDRGFGFITEDGGEDVFVHVKSLPSGIKQLQPGVKVRFDKKHTDRGVQASSVMFLPAGSAEEADDTPDYLTEAEFLTEMQNILPPLREVHKQAFLDIAREHGWVESD